MSNSGTTEHGRNVVTRWRLLAQRRLDHLVELYETGRWKLYHQEQDFLRMVQEARAAVKTWEKLSPPDPVQDKPVEVTLAQVENSAIPVSPFLDSQSANGVEAKGDLSEA